MIEMIDTYPQVKKLLEQGGFRMDAWEAYMAGVDPELPGRLKEDAGEYDFETQVLPVLAFTFAHPGLAEEAHRSFLSVMAGTEERIGALPGGVDSVVMLYLGLCNSAGWATQLKGRPAVLLGLEKIVELGWTDLGSVAGLVCHELGHNWHFQNRTAPAFPETARGEALWQLYTEGVAMTAEHLLSGEEAFSTRNKNGWLSWCRENRAWLAGEYLRRLETGESIQEFFGDWCSLKGRSDTGYYLGWELVSLAEGERGLAGILDLTPGDVEHYLKQVI